VAQKRDRPIVFKKRFVSFLEKQCHYTSAPRLRGSPIGYYRVEESLQLPKNRFTPSLEELRGYSIFTGGLPITKLSESRPNFVDIYVWEIVSEVADKWGSRVSRVRWRLRCVRRI
jgi:hypothetical protein